jgi:hypothetical protein
VERWPEAVTLHSLIPQKLSCQYHRGDYRLVWNAILNCNALPDEVTKPESP